MATDDPPPSADLSRSSDETERVKPPGLAQWSARSAVAIFVVVSLVGLVAWLQRERIAIHFIDDFVAENGLEAQYDIVSIGVRRHVIANLVVGPEQAPDLTAERVTLELGYSAGQPTLRAVDLVRPKLNARWVDQTFSLGSLDSLIYSDSQEPFVWPKIDLGITEGGARITSEFGTIAVDLDGRGRLDDGFAGDLSATANRFGTAECLSQAASLAGTITTEAGRPSFDGDIGLRKLQCAGGELKDASFATSATLADDLSRLDAKAELEALEASYSSTAIDRFDGGLEIVWRLADPGAAPLSVTHSLQGAGVSTEYGLLERVTLDGQLQLFENYSHAQWDSQVSGSQATLDPGTIARLSDLRRASDGAFATPLLARFQSSLGEVLAQGKLEAKVSLRSDTNGLWVDVPEAQLWTPRGDKAIALSKFAFERPQAGADSRLRGEIVTSGAGLPAIDARIEAGSAGERVVDLSMAEYRVGQDAVAIPRLRVRQARDGRVRFAGRFAASGALPGGRIEQMTGPIEGIWSPRTGLSLGRRCATITFAALDHSGLSLDENALNLCPGAGGAMLRYRDQLELAIVSDAINLTGSMADAPAEVGVTRAELAFPGAIEVTGLSARLGRPENVLQLSADRIEGQADERIEGSLYGGSAASDDLPFELSDISGGWSFADGVLRLANGSLLLRDRPTSEAASKPRFEPLASSNARLVLDGENLSAEADMLHARSGTLLAKVLLAHDLSSGEGRADFALPGVTFTDAFQPDDLSFLTRGVIADAEGTIDGEGEVLWTADTVESSGSFRSDDFDLAAAFGVVRGLRGEVVFDDLIELTTAPSQVLEIDSINPGVEALSGRIVYSITNGDLVEIEDARWPFMGGELILRPIALDFGGSDGQDYIFELVGIDAGSFVTEMDLTNIGASGTFDGTVPIHFDAKGNGSVRGGLAIARAPGGNVSYVGELTYEDLGTMANYAFQSLRSLDYTQMSVELNGDLGGEIITSFLLDGVSQGEGASQNFVTRRLAKLPIRFKVNVRSDNFSDLALIVRGLFVPSVFDDEAARRRLGIEGPIVDSPVPVNPIDTSEPGEQIPAQKIPQLDEPTVQPPESDDLQ